MNAVNSMGPALYQLKTRSFKKYLLNIFSPASPRNCSNATRPLRAVSGNSRPWSSHYPPSRAVGSSITASCPFSAARKSSVRPLSSFGLHTAPLLEQQFHYGLSRYVHGKSETRMPSAYSWIPQPLVPCGEHKRFWGWY